MLRFESDVAVIKLEPFDNVEELKKIAYGLYRKTAIGELKGIVLDLQGQDKLEDGLVRELFYIDVIRCRTRSYHNMRNGESRFVVLCNSSPGRFRSPNLKSRNSSFPVVETVEEAIASIMKCHDVFPGRSDVPVVLPADGPGRIFAVGCAEQDLSDIPEQLRETGFEVAESATDTVKDGDHVIFCVSCSCGPTDGTKSSVRSCAGREIIPVGIVWNFSEVVVDKSLLELVSFEMKDLLSEILPQEVIDSLPVFYDFDLNLPANIAGRLNQKLLSFRCK